MIIAGLQMVIAGLQMVISGLQQSLQDYTSQPYPYTLIQVLEASNYFVTVDDEKQPVFYASWRHTRHSPSKFYSPYPPSLFHSHPSSIPQSTFHPDSPLAKFISYLPFRPSTVHSPSLASFKYIPSLPSSICTFFHPYPLPSLPSSVYSLSQSSCQYIESPPSSNYSIPCLPPRDHHSFTTSLVNIPSTFHFHPLESPSTTQCISVLLYTSQVAKPFSIYCTVYVLYCICIVRYSRSKYCNVKYVMLD